MSLVFLAKNLLPAISLVTLAVIVPLNSVIMGNPGEPVCLSCLATVYASSIGIVSLWLYFSQKVCGEKLYGASLKTFTIVALIFFVHAVEVTTIPKTWRLAFVIMSILGFLLLMVAFVRGRTEITTQFLLFALMLSFYEAVNLARIVHEDNILYSNSPKAVEASWPARSGTDLPHVFLVVFDEFSLVHVLKAGMLDRMVVPNLVMFSETATWYRQAITSHDETEYAISALLTGRQNVNSFRQEFLERSPTHHLFQAVAKTHALYISGFSLEYCQAFSAYVRGCENSILGFSNYDFLFRNWWVRAVPGAFRNAFTDRFIRDGVIRLVGSPYLQPNANSSFSAALGLGQDFGGPTFTYLHIALPHHPYVFGRNGEILWDPTLTLFTLREFPKMPPQMLSKLSDSFREQVTYTDRLFGGFLLGLKERGLYDQSLIVVTSDHGITFDPQNPGRGGGWVDDAIARVPLVIKMPGQRAGEIDDRPVSIIDIYPTMLHVLGLDHEVSDGLSVLDQEWDPERLMVTDSITCDRACKRGQQHPRFVKTDQGWVNADHRPAISRRSD